MALVDSRSRCTSEKVQQAMHACNDANSSCGLFKRCGIVSSALCHVHLQRAEVKFGSATNEMSRGAIVQQGTSAAWPAANDCTPRSSCSAEFSDLAATYCWTSSSEIEDACSSELAMVHTQIEGAALIGSDNRGGSSSRGSFSGNCISCNARISEPAVKQNRMECPVLMTSSDRSGSTSGIGSDSDMSSCISCLETVIATSACRRLPRGQQSSARLIKAPWWPPSPAGRTLHG